MKIKLYTKSHAESLLREIDHGGGRFTSEEHAYVIEKEFGKDFEKRESLLESYLRKNYHKLSALGFLIQYIYQKKYKNIISLGAGSCVLEYLLKCMLPEKSKVVAADFDSFQIKSASRHLPSIIPVEFDFFKDDLRDLQKKLKIDFDLAVFFGSSYVMDDPEFVRLYRGLKEIGVKEIIDFHAGYIPRRKIPKIIFLRLGSYVLNKIGLLGYRGKLHGYGRTRGELRRLFKQAGLDLIQEVSVPDYEYVAICKQWC